jgi:hypothetical protein
MGTSPEDLTDEQLSERFGVLVRAFDKAFLARDEDQAKQIAEQMKPLEVEIKRRHAGKRKPSGLEPLTVDQLVDRFIAMAIEENEADGIEAVDRVYWQIDAVERELERRAGDQRRALLPLYTHPDVRVRYRAAEATRALAPELARDRLLAVDDEHWSRPTEAGVRRPHALKGLTVTELVERFVTLALEQDQAMLLDEIPKVNRLFWMLQAVAEELKSRPGDERRALAALFDHPNAQVRLKAAQAALAVAPEAARQALQLISDRDEYPQAAYARGTIDALAEGRYRPT